MAEKLVKQVVLLGLVVMLHWVLGSASTSSTAEEPLTIRPAEPRPDPAQPEPHSSNSSARVKRQFGCPSGCYSSCMNNQQCQRYQVATVCMLGCCCPQTNLSCRCAPARTLPFSGLRR